MQCVGVADAVLQTHEDVFKYLCDEVPIFDGRDLGNNQLSGTIPGSLSGCKKLSTL